MIRRGPRAVLPLWRQAIYVPTRLASTQPPKPRDFKPNLSQDNRYAENLYAGAGEHEEPKDPQRGIEAAQRAAATGKLDPRYKPAARKYTALIVSLPIFLYLSYELFRRGFQGVKQREIPRPDSKEQDAAT